MTDRKRRTGRKAVSLAPVGTARTVIADPSGRGTITVSRRADILEMERSHQRISEAAYRVGRRVQVLLEKCDRALGSTWFSESRVDGRSPCTVQIERLADDAAKLVPLVNDMRSRLGHTDTKLLRAVVGDRLGFADCAELLGKSGEHGTRYAATRFRDALEHLADAWGAKGPSRRTPDDSFNKLAAAHAV